jgi:hypothetical protein
MNAILVINFERHENFIGYVIGQCEANAFVCRNSELKTLGKNTWLFHAVIFPLILILPRFCVDSFT